MISLATMASFVFIFTWESLGSAFQYRHSPFKRYTSVAYSPYEETIDHETTKDNLLSYLALHSSSSPMLSSYLNETKLQQKLTAMEEFQSRSDIIYNFANLAGIWSNIYSDVNNNFSRNTTLRELSFGAFNESHASLRMDEFKQQIKLTSDADMSYDNIITFIENDEEIQRLIIKGKAIVDKRIIGDDNVVRLNVTFYEAEVVKKKSMGGTCSSFFLSFFLSFF